MFFLSFVFLSLVFFVLCTSIETGILEKSFNISTRDPISNIIVFLSPNTVITLLYIELCYRLLSWITLNNNLTFCFQTHVGRYQEDFYRFQRNGLVHTYVSSGVSAVKIPSLAYSNNGGQLEGYDFSTDAGKKASYFYVLQQFGKLNEEGSASLPYNLWLEDKFLLPFCLSANNNVGGANAGLMNKTQPRSISPSNDFSIYCKFENPVQKVLRLTVVYSQLRSLAIEHDRTTFKGYEAEQ